MRLTGNRYFLVCPFSVFSFAVSASKKAVFKVRFFVNLAGAESEEVQGIGKVSCFIESRRWVYTYFSTKERPNLIARECLSKQSFQLYKKHAVKLKTWSKQLFIAVETETERLVKRYGIKDSSPNEKFIKTVQKAATAKGMTVAEYRDKILFPHGKEKIIKRFELYHKLKNETQKQGR